VTGTAPHSPQLAEDWPASRHSGLLNDLSRHLDPDAGLRDIMLHAHHAALTSVLGRRLNTPAGFAAILPLTSGAASRRTPGQSETAAAIAAADPAARVALRRDPVTLAVILSDLTVRTLTIADKANDRARALDLARDLVSELDLARDLVRNLDLDLDLDHAHARALDLDLDLARDLDLDLALDLAHARARDLVSDLARAVALALTLARHRDLARDITHVRDLARDLAFIRHLGPARHLARQTTLMVGDILGLQQVEGLAAALLEGALDDFTHADLSLTDLTGRDLTGIRWSDQGTTWPPGIDTDELRARSQEIAPGIYEITRPGHGGKARHHIHA
jgi:hypothetical protein